MFKLWCERGINQRQSSFFFETFRVRLNMNLFKIHTRPNLKIPRYNGQLRLNCSHICESTKV